MYLKEELASYRELYNEIEAISPRSYLTPEEIEAIGSDKISFFNLRNRVITPKNTWKPSTGERERQFMF